MRYFVAALITASAIFPSSVFAKKTAEQILADYAAELGTNRLAKDAGDPTGLTFLRLANMLDDANETQLLTFAYLKRGKEIKPLKTSFTEEKFAKLLKARTNYLMKRMYSKNSKVGDLAKLYLQVAELLKPDDKEIILGIAKLERRGHKDSLNDLLDRDTKAKDLLAPKKTEVIRVKPKDPPKLNVKVNNWGIGYGESYLTRKLYGRVIGRRYIKKPSEYQIMFRSNGYRYIADIHFGKCRHINFSVLSSVVPEVERTALSEMQGWKKIRSGYYESMDNKLCAIYSGGCMNIWEKDWYEKKFGRAN